MVGSNAEVRVAIVGDNSSLQRSLSESQGSMRTWGAAIGKIAVAAGIAAAGGIAVLGKASVEAASDAQQSIGATETVWGHAADEIIRHSKRAAEQVGLSATDYRQAANLMGGSFINAGVEVEKAAGWTDDLTERASDMFAAFGTGADTVTTVTDAMASAFRGEFDPLERFNVQLTAAKITTAANELAMKRYGSELKDLPQKQQDVIKRQATYNEIMRQSGAVAGQFKRESGTLANQQQKLAARWDDLKAKLGTALLPAMTDLVTMLNREVVPAVSDLADEWMPKLQAALSDVFAGDPGAGAQQFADAFSGIDWAELGQGASDLAAAAQELAPAFRDAAASGIGDTLTVTAEVMGFLADHVETLSKAMPFLVAGFVAWKSAQALNAVAGRDSLVGMVLQYAQTRKLDAATKSLTAAVRELNTAQATTASSVTATGNAAAASTSKVSKLGVAAKGAAGAAGLGLLAAGAMTTNESLGAVETTAGAVATGFAVGGPWGAAIGGAVGLVQSLVSANDGLVNSMSALDDAMRSNDVDALAESIRGAREELDKATSATVYGSSAFGDFGGKIINTLAPMSNLTHFMGGLTGDTEDTAAALERAETRLQEIRDGTYQAGFAMGDFAYVIERNAEAAQEEADALRDATDAMRDKRSEAQHGLNAELDYQAAIDDANRALKENGKTVDKSTEAGRANRRALYDVAEAWNNQSDAAKNAKGSLSEARRGFIETATQMGLTKAAAKRLADELFEIPTKRTTKIQLDGVEAATSQARTLKQVIEDTHSKDIYINLHYQTIGNKPKAPTPGDPNGRSVVDPSKTVAERKADAYNEGVAVADRFGAGVLAKVKGGLKLAEDLFGQLGPQFNLTSAEIGAGLDALAKRIEKVVNKRIKDDQKATKRISKISEALREQTRALRANAKAQDENAGRLDSATNTFNNYVAAIKDSVVSFGDITQLGRTDSGKVTLAKLLRDLQQRAAQAKQFNEIVQQLAAAGLDKAQIEQLTAAGPEAALATAQAIAAGGANAIEQVNALSRDIATSGGSLGVAIGDQFAIAGHDSALAYIKGLEDEQDRLDRTAQRMAKALARELDKQLAALQQANQQNQQQNGNKRELTDAAVNGTGGRTPVATVRLTSQQVSQLERGREIQLDLDAYRAAGGRSRR